MEEYQKELAKIESTFLGIEDHGILIALLRVSFGAAGMSIGGYALDDRMEFVRRVLAACGVTSWEKVAGRTIYVLYADERRSKVVGIENLPTERGERFIFADVWEEEE